jgi:4-hydroxythreonine-4-phosphate dehydrogenase
LPVPDQLIDTGPAALITPGRISAAAGAVAAAAIEEAIAGTQDGRYAALVTNPIHKQAIHAAGVPFPGHTEWLAARCGVSGETMLMCHVPLQAVPAALSPQRLIAVGRLLHAALRRIRGRSPRLAICGFNPHAGEGGLFGHEDEVVVPAVYELLQLGIDCEGPLPPDTAFTPAARRRYDGFIALYHDQGLIPFKALHFDTGVNVTLGLPLVRTSVDHGTAFDIAWQGIAQHSSLVSAITLAARLAA